MKNENELQKLREQLNSISEQINKLETKPEYEVGVWYKSESYFVRPSDLSDLSEAKVYGFKEGEWFNFNRDFNMNGVQKLVLATETEIKDMLEKESIKRGFKEGVTVNRDLFNRAYNPDPDVVIGNNKFHYDKEEDVLFVDDRLIYRRGLWATIVVVKEPKIEIGGYEVGKWYKRPHNKCLVKMLTLPTSGNSYYKCLGFSEGGAWMESEPCQTYLDGEVLATETEIKDMLEKESIKRGFKEGVTVNREMFNHAYCPDPEVVIGGNEFHYDKEDDVLFIDGWLIYRQGLWATIVKEPEIEIGGYEVDFNKGISVNYTTIDGHTFTKDFWQAAKIISLHSKAKIMIGCSKQFDVSLETINLILAKL